MASLERASHFSSRRSCSSAWVAKNFVLFRAGCPSGFKRLAAIRIGISCNSKPKNHALWVASSRAGTIFQLRNSACSDVVFILPRRLSQIEPRRVYAIHKKVLGSIRHSECLNQSRLDGYTWRVILFDFRGRDCHCRREVRRDMKTWPNNYCSAILSV